MYSVKTADAQNKTTFMGNVTADKKKKKTEITGKFESFHH